VQPAVVFFDIGQTLVEGGAQSARRLLGSRLNLTEKETRRVGKFIMIHFCMAPASLSNTLAEMLPNHSPEIIHEAVESVWSEQEACAREISGAGPLLKSLKAQGVKLGLISNIWHPFYVGFSRNCSELASIVDYSFLSYCEGVKKPSPHMFHQALKMTGHAPDSCWMVGDSYELDMAPAMRAGFNTLWVLRHPEREKGLLARVLRNEETRPHWIVESLDEILPFFMGC
jgi:HAD superfamily hydrolase (TIGR01549 family)